MKFTEAPLAGAYVVEPEPFRDHRGAFMRVFCDAEFSRLGLATHMVQSNLSITSSSGVIRGMHYQTDGSEEDKLVSCVKGAILDVIIDVRRDSATFGRHFKIELSENNHHMLYVPRGCAHGFLTLADDSRVFYQVSNAYNSARERGIRWNDPFFAVEWPIDNPVTSDKDARYPDFDPRG